MARQDRNIPLWADFAIVFAVAVAATAVLWPLLAPKKPDIVANERAERQDPTYRPGGSSCDPAEMAKIRPPPARLKQADRCKEAAEQHRFQQNNLIQQTRAADATQATTSLAYGQTRIGAFEAIVGTITLVAASVAAIYAKHAALHAGRSATAAERQMASAERPRVLEEQVTIDDLSGPPQGVGGGTLVTYNWKSLGPGIAWIRGNMVGHAISLPNGVPVFQEPEYTPLNWPLPAGKGWGRNGTSLLISEEDRAACAAGE